MRATDDWQAVAARFPAGWQPDFVVLNLGYTCVPASLWSAPVPLVGLAPDWNLLWHAYRHRLRQCDLVLTDTLGVETLLREGIPHALAANLYGCDRSFVEEPWLEVPRDLDVLFVGNFNPAVQRQRLPWLARVARLAGRRKVLLARNVFGADYRRLLARARIVFNYANRGECNLRVFEAAAAGALLFQEEGNREVPALFRHRHECVCYNSDNLEFLLDHYLDHEDERRTIAEAARAAVRQYTFSNLWEQHLERIEAEWPALQERARQRFVPAVAEALRARAWEVLGSSLGDDPTLVHDLRTTLARHPAAVLRNALGVLAGQGLDAANPSPRRRRRKKKQARKQGALPPGSDSAPPEGNGKQKPAALALAHFRSALARDPADVLAGLNAAEALGQLGKVPQAQDALQRLEQPGTLAPANLDVCHFPPVFDLFRVEWERAAWTNAGQPDAEAAAKRDLLRWRLHVLLAEWTGDLEHYQKAQQARPDLWPSLAALGCAFGRARRPADAVVHLRAAVADNPFDAAAAQALFHALGECGDRAAQQTLAAERRSLAAALGHNAPPPVAEVPPAPPAHPEGWLETLPREEFHRRFGSPDTARALCGYTNAGDTQVVLTLLAHARPRRVLEIGTALGHMTANLTEWTPDDAVVFSLGTTADLAVPTAEPQRYETPERGRFGCMANSFGKVGKVFFITADSLTYDFARLGGIDFAFLDGAHDLRHVLSDTCNVYDILRPGGLLVWHDFTSTADWVEVRRALERLRFAEPVVHVAGTAVAFLRKAAATGGPPVAVQERQAGRPSLRAGRQVEYLPHPLRVVWEGAQQVVHSFGLVNREMCSRLLARGHEVSVLACAHPGLAERGPAGAAPPAGYRIVEGDDVRLSPELAASFYRPLSGPADVHVRPQWPPQLTPPPQGHWVLVQPWEYGSIPRGWLEALNQVDEVWAYTEYVRDCYLAAGVPADRVHVVPCGVACERFSPQAAPLPLPTTKRFKFLFVGGTIHR